MVWDGQDPRLDNPTQDRWFDTSGFSRLPDFTPRSNPWNFQGLYGPGVLNMDLGLVKAFRVTERVGLQLKMDAFNVLNNMSWGDPSRNINSANFGRSTNIANLTYGRRIQLGARIEF
jgi:hypothetical protein